MYPRPWTTHVTDDFPHCRGGHAQHHKGARRTRPCTIVDSRRTRAYQISGRLPLPFYRSFVPSLPGSLPFLRRCPSLFDSSSAATCHGSPGSRFPRNSSASSRLAGIGMSCHVRSLLPPCITLIHSPTALSAGGSSLAPAPSLYNAQPFAPLAKADSCECSRCLSRSFHAPFLRRGLPPGEDGPADRRGRAVPDAHIK